MPDETVKNVSVTGRYTETTTKTKNINNDNRTTTTTKTIKFYSKDGTQIKADYYDAAEAKDLANMNGYGEYYKTEVISKDGKFYVKVTAKTKQPVGFLAEDYLGKINDGTLRDANPEYFKGLRCEDGDGKRVSDLNHEMNPGEYLLIPADKVVIKDSPVGWFKRNVTHVNY